MAKKKKKVEYDIEPEVFYKFSKLMTDAGLLQSKVFEKIIVDFMIKFKKEIENYKRTHY